MPVVRSILRRPRLSASPWVLAPTLSDSGLVEIAVIADQRDPLPFAQLRHGTAALSPERQIELIDGVGDGGGFSGVPAPSLEQTKAIAEEGFIYGLPLVMNYAVMHEYAVDKGGPQFKAPFNQIKNEPRVLHLPRHGHHHSEQRHPVLVCSGWTCARSRW